MKKEHRCEKCGALLAIEENDTIQILCTHRGKRTECLKCNTICQIPLKHDKTVNEPQ